MTKEILQNSLLTSLRLCKLGVMAGVLLLVTAYLSQSRTPTVLETVQSKGEIVVVSRNGPTTYYEGPEGYTGFEYSLAKRFAKHLGVKLVIQDVEDLGEMIDVVGNGKGHFAAAGLTVTENRKRKVKFSPGYMKVTQHLIYKKGTKKPKSLEELVGKKILVIGNSSHVERLRELQRTLPGLDWEESHEVEMLDLIEMVHNGKVEHVIVDSNAYEMNKNLYPNAKVAFDISEEQELAWAFPDQKDDSLYKEAQKFFAGIEKKGVIQDTLERYYGHLGEINYSGAIVFTHRLKTRLPKWKNRLQDAAKENQLDWQLLAALAYQESHWNPKAKSRTGVRGFMMLTRNTAKEMGIKNRLDPNQSIKGGAKYFSKMLRRIPKHIKNPDRTWFALAAYNVGFGHVKDARILTEQQGGDPDRWTDVRERLPLLAKRKYYKQTKHGYARGWEAVDYVQNIRNFYTIIAWNGVEKERLTELALMDEKASETQFAKFSPVVTEALRSISATSL